VALFIVAIAANAARIRSPDLPRTRFPAVSAFIERKSTSIARARRLHSGVVSIINSHDDHPLTASELLALSDCVFFFWRLL